MNKKYHGYTADHLLNDDFFIQSVLNSTIQTDEFWKSQMDNDPKLKLEIEKARSFIIDFKEIFSVDFLSKEDQDILWKRIQQKNNRKRHLVHLWLSAGSVAAAILLLLLLIPFGKEEEVEFNYQSLITKVDTLNQSQDVQLILSEEETVTIPEKESNIVYNKEGQVQVNAQQIERMDSEKNTKGQQDNKKDVQKMNQLIVPKGKRSFLTLSDGTKVWVNSGSQLIYPSTFKSDKREIYVEGEVYLDVIHDEKRPFHVKTKHLNVSVLGTVFNVCAYPEDASQEVVLVSGKVKVENENKQRIIHPSEKYEYDKEYKSVTVNQVNTDDYTAWINGYYQFQQEPFFKILNRLSRYYGVSFNIDDQVKDLKCSGKLNLTDEVMEVLHNLKKALPIAIYKNEKNIITIKYKSLK